MQEKGTLCLCHGGLVGTEMSSARCPQHCASLGTVDTHGPGWSWGPRCLGFPESCSALALLSEDALQAQAQHQPALSAHEDGSRTHPCSRDAKLKKIKLKKKQSRGKQPAICQTSNFQLDFQKHFSFENQERREHKTPPLPQA